MSVTAAPIGSPENPIPREAGRVLLLDAAGRVLLVRGADPARPGSRYWFTIGGGLDPGESLAQAAARELFEETGLRVEPDALGEPFRHEVIDFPYEGTWYRQRQAYFVLRVPAWEVPVDQLAPEEEHYIHEHRWWSADEIATTTERVYPLDLADLLRRILGP
jgi:8-oxo-dGTP pyrophosphatase MutT (NUDIX family)